MLWRCVFVSIECYRNKMNVDASFEHCNRVFCFENPTEWATSLTTDASNVSLYATEFQEDAIAIHVIFIELYVCRLMTRNDLTHTYTIRFYSSFVDCQTRSDMRWNKRQFCVEKLLLNRK